MKVIIMIIIISTCLLSGCVEIENMINTEETPIQSIPAIVETPPVPVPTVNPQLLIYQEFLEQDTTNEVNYSRHEKFTIEHSCGHFTRQLCENASTHNLSMGGAILSTTKNFDGHDNHALAYFIIDHEYYFIESDNDRIYDMEYLYNSFGWEYIKLYENGRPPTRWRGNLHYDINLEELYGE